ncbi:putative preimplantation protein 3 [Paratrimastix pyriformis]|uniref:Preimplantation protein 3 n=1 Tax=Paratrimastix pyriformis TaxID=342808 RepID=A0ABQ8UBM8_9EUKA|nr:putative preimplantation protein 3 [Paratrimastix pyriformis]
MIRRNTPGTKSAQLNAWPDQELNEMDSCVALQQYIQQLIRKDCSDVKTICQLPEGQDEALWQYEHLRQLTMELNKFVTSFDGICTDKTCFKMKATDEWHYLCAAHKKPKECCAIDYIIHTLDGTAALLNSTKWFPDRVHVPVKSLKYFKSIARRLYRIFAHAYFHHRPIFDEFENETHLCERFVVFCKLYDLVPDSCLIIPPNEFMVNKEYYAYLCATIVSSSAGDEEGGAAPTPAAAAAPAPAPSPASTASTIPLAIPTPSGGGPLDLGASTAMSQSTMGRSVVAEVEQASVPAMPPPPLEGAASTGVGETPAAGMPPPPPPPHEEA